MTKNELEERISALATKACDLRCDLEELNQEVQEEALYADREDDEEMWNRWDEILEEFAASVAEVEELFFNVKERKTSIYCPA
ncbi:MAG: hypothetical protein IKQ20_03620 [Bacteroidales bacterium]|nr:hypothetical protein [Bacteroidales bacterium]